jgi:hypothetical protein
MPSRDRKKGSRKHRYASDGVPRGEIRKALSELVDNFSQLHSSLRASVEWDMKIYTQRQKTRKSHMLAQIEKLSEMTTKARRVLRPLTRREEELLLWKQLTGEDWKE